MQDLDRNHDHGAAWSFLTIVIFKNVCVHTSCRLALYARQMKDVQAYYCACCLAASLSNLWCYPLRHAKKLTIITICSKHWRGLPNNNQWSRRYRWNQLSKIAILVWAVIVCWVCAADELSDFSLYVVNVCEEFSLAVLIHQMCRISFQRCSKLLVLVSFFALGVHGMVGLSSASLCRC